MTQVEKYKQAMQLLKELNCPKPICEALEWWGMCVYEDQVKIHNWVALAGAGMIDGECVEKDMIKLAGDLRP